MPASALPVSDGTVRLAWSYARVSRGAQAGADRSGLGRQEAALQRWLAEHPEFELVEALVDPGVSAGRGKHRSTGALGRFLAAARAGAVPPGSCLVVESMSRFSRETERQVLSALLDGIWRVRLGVAFCSDGGTVLTPELIDAEPHRLHGLLGAMAQARAEWLEKSRRSKGAALKRRQLQDEGEKVAAAIPWWITKGQDGAMHLDPVAARTIRRAVELSIRGNGRDRIATLLQAEGHPPPPTSGRRNQWGKTGGGWTSGRVAWLLGHRGLAGDLHRQDGVVIAGFYPPVIDRSELEQLRAAATRRDKLRPQLRGTGSKCRFLLQSACRCSCCKAPMSFHPPGRGARADHPGWIGCRSCNRREAPEPTLLKPTGKGYIPADELEAHCLTRLSRGLWAELLEDPGAEQERKQLEAQVAELRHQTTAARAQLQKLQERAEELWVQDASEERQATAERAITRCRQQLEALEAQHQAAAMALQQARARPSGACAAAELQGRVQAFWQQLETASNEERVSFNRWLVTHPLQPRFTVGPRPPAGGDRLVQLWLQGRLAGSEPLAGMARGIARQRGLVDPAMALDARTPDGNLLALVGGREGALLVEAQADGTQLDRTDDWRSGASLRGLARALERRLPAWLEQEGASATAKQVRRLAVQLAARELGLVASPAAAVQAQEREG